MSVSAETRDCCICYDDTIPVEELNIISHQDRLYKMSCSHGDQLHERCMKQWIERDASCPLCRAKLESVEDLSKVPDILKNIRHLVMGGLHTTAGVSGIASKILNFVEDVLLESSHAVREKAKEQKGRDKGVMTAIGHVIGVTAVAPFIGRKIAEKLKDTAETGISNYHKNLELAEDALNRFLEGTPSSA